MMMMMMMMIVSCYSLALHSLATMHFVADGRTDRQTTVSCQQIA